MQKAGETHETAPIQPAGASTWTGDENVIAGQTVPGAETLVAPPGPVTLSVKVYFCAAAPPSAGKVTGTATLAGAEPAAQAVVTGRPATAGVAETVHCAERLTMADTTVPPPADGRSAGFTAT